MFLRCGFQRVVLPVPVAGGWVKIDAPVGMNTSSVGMGVIVFRIRAMNFAVIGGRIKCTTRRTHLHGQRAEIPQPEKTWFERFRRISRKSVTEKDSIGCQPDWIN
jgi:hypothetical protein